MTTLAEKAAAWMGGRLEAASGVAIKYRRGSADCELTAVPARRESDDYGVDGAAAVATQHDWILDPTKLQLDGDLVLPDAGDLIVTDDGQAFVVVFDDAENCWRWTDQYRQRIRVHAVERSATGEDE